MAGTHVIFDKDKLTVSTVTGTHATIGAAIQTLLKGATFSAGDKIVEINIFKKSAGNNYVAVITWEAM